MPYLNLKTQSFGHDINDVRAAYPDSSIPDGCSHGDFVWYDHTQPMPSGLVEAVETSPTCVGDIYIQTWRYIPVAKDQALLHLESCVRNRLMDFAKAKGYDSIMSACSYASSQIPKFAAEGQFACKVRDYTWAAFYDYVARIESGEVPMPSTFQEVEAMLPSANWPL